MRIGVLGGTFDPPHIGHLIAAVDAYESPKLDRLIFIQTASQPHKTATPAIASAKDRLEMLRLAVGTDPRFEVSDTEVERGGLSYTVDTLETLKAEHPDSELVLIVGRDALAAFDRWKNPDRIRELATLAVVARNGDPTTSAPADRFVTVVNSRQVDVSSTEIRKRLSEGKSVRGFVAESVEAYIAAQNLYRKG